MLFQSQLITLIIMIFLLKKRNSSITLPIYRYLKEKEIPPNSFKY